MILSKFYKIINRDHSLHCYFKQIFALSVYLSAINFFITFDIARCYCYYFVFYHIIINHCSVSRNKSPKSLFNCSS